MNLRFLVSLIITPLLAWSASNKILFVTNEYDLSHAVVVKRVFENLKPFSLMNTSVEIKYDSLYYNNCYLSGRSVVCSRDFYKYINKLKKSAGADAALVILSNPNFGGAGSRGDLSQAALATTGLGALFSIHELMHVFNFSDEYDYSDDSCRWGYNAELARRGEVSGCSVGGPTTLMKADTRCIPQSYWPRIAKVLGTSVPNGPDECGEVEATPEEHHRTMDPIPDDDETPVHPKRPKSSGRKPNPKSWD